MNKREKKMLFACGGLLLLSILLMVRISYLEVSLAYLRRPKVSGISKETLIQHTLRTGTEQQTNRTLVIIMGNLRASEDAWETLYSNVLDPNSADLALIIGETPEANRTSSLYKRAKYTWFFKEYDDWADAIDLINGTSWRKTHLPKVNPESGLLGGVKGYVSSGAVVHMIRWFLSNHIKELKLYDKYDRFVITRSDHYYECTHDVSQFHQKYLWIPPGEDWGGYTDRHLIVSSKNVLKALDVLPTFFQFPVKEEDIKNMNTEQVLKEAWKKHGLVVRYFPRVMFTCAISTDTTRWTPGSDPVPGVPGLLKKYKNEYTMTMETCYKDDIVLLKEILAELKGNRRSQLKKFEGIDFESRWQK